MPFLVLVGDNVTRISDGLNNVELRREFQNFRMLLVGLSFQGRYLVQGLITETLDRLGDFLSR